jgi:hypothetical protein
VFADDVGIRLHGKERKDVQEYCVSEGWVKVPAGNTPDRSSGPLLIKLIGHAEPFYRLAPLANGAAGDLGQETAFGCVSERPILAAS